MVMGEVTDNIVSKKSNASDENSGANNSRLSGKYRAQLTTDSALDTCAAIKKQTKGEEDFKRRKTDIDTNKNLEQIKDQRSILKNLLKDQAKTLPVDAKASIEESVVVFDNVIPVMETVVNDIDGINAVILDPVTKSLETSSKKSIEEINSAINLNFRTSNKLAYASGIVGIIALILTLITTLPILSNFDFINNKKQTVNTSDSSLAVVMEEMRGENNDIRYAMLDFRNQFISQISNAKNTNEKQNVFKTLDNQLLSILSANTNKSKTNEIQAALAIAYLDLFRLHFSSDKSIGEKLLSNTQHYLEIAESNTAKNEFKWIEAQTLSALGKYNLAEPVLKELSTSDEHMDVIDLATQKNISITQAAKKMMLMNLSKTKRIFLLNSGMRNNQKPIAGPVKNLLANKGYRANNISVDNFKDQSSNIHAYYRTKDDLTLLNQMLTDIYPNLNLNKIDRTQYKKIGNKDIKKVYFDQKKQDIVIRLPHYP